MYIAVSEWAALVAVAVVFAAGAYVGWVFGGLYEWWKGGNK